MSDNSPWQSPSGPDPVSGATPVPPSGATPPPPPPPPPPPGYAAPPPGWTPPPKPGLIPLAPMGLGVILGASFRVLRRNPRPVVGFSLLLHLFLAIINIAVSALLTVGALGKYFDALNTISTTGQVSKASLAAAGSSVVVASLTSFISQLFTYAGDTILQGIITAEVSRGTVGEKLPLSALWARARGRIPALLGWAGLVILATVVVLGIFGGIIAVLFIVGGTTGAIVGGILAFVLAFGAIVVGIWLGTKLSLVPSALIIERLTLRHAISRSWSLTRGYFWRVFGIQLLVGVIIAVAASIIEAPVTVVIEVITALGNPTGIAQGSSALKSVFGISTVVSEIVAALIATVTAIISTATTALIYIDLRIRKEGLDLALMRFVDARAAGTRDVVDPYLTGDSLGSDAADGSDQAA